MVNTRLPETQSTAERSCRADPPHEVVCELKRWPHMHQAVTKNDPPCILLAEDDDQLRLALATALSKQGYDVVECRSA